MRVLILGGGGMLGHKLWQVLPQHFDTWMTIRKTRQDYSKIPLFQSKQEIENLDVSDFRSVQKVLAELKPQVIVNCIAVTKRHMDPKNHVASITLNSLLPHQLAHWGQENGTRIIHFSTDCVFDGKSGGYTEDNLTDADDVYGKTKALGELHGPGCVTIRSSFIGREISHHTELVEWFLDQKGKSIKGFRQAIYTGLTTPVAARVVQKVIAEFPSLSGLYHVASEPITKFELLTLLKEAFKLNVEIKPEDSFVCRRNLIGTRFKEATRFVAPSWKEMIAELAMDPTPYDQWRAV